MVGIPTRRWFRNREFQQEYISRSGVIKAAGSPWEFK